MAVIDSNSALAKVGANVSFLRNWSLSNEEKFEQVMECLADEKPDRFAEIYLKVQTLIQEPRETKKTVNINVNNDMQKLQALATTIDPKHRIEPNNKKTEYADFKEIK